MKDNKYSLGYKHSKETLLKKSRAQLGKKGSNWQGDKVKYSGVHIWLKKTFGKAIRCENKNCSYPKMGTKKFLDKPYRYEWALVKRKKYERKRECFIQLYISCHRKYDSN